MRAFLWNWVLTASALTAAVLFLRAAFGRRIGARVRYALWALVLARLLVPGQFYTAPVEAPRVLPEPRTVQTLPAPRRTPAAEIPPSGGGEPDRPVPNAAPVETAAAPEARLSPEAAAGGVWLAGTAAMAAAFLISNVRFARRLRRIRVPLAADCPPRVYTAAGLPSPCLFGVLRPAVYVTPEAAAEPGMLRHVLAHEATHFRHGDHIWSVLRCAALAVHWWNPLVWLAAVLSRRDAELACDEGALKALGDGERRAYGNTLLALITARPGPGDLLRCATTMTGDRRSLRERVSRIARAPKRWFWAAALSVVLAVLVCACSFAKTKTPETHEDGPLTAEELAYFNTEVFNNENGFNLRNQFLVQAVETPEDYKQIDLFQLFYNGTGDPMEVTEEERQAAGGGQVDLTKCTAAGMDAALREHLGLGLEDTDQVGLDQFTYLEEYDAYYFFHGDTNSGRVIFTSGEWKDGNILLYYEGDVFPRFSSGNGEMNMVSSGPACVTLEPQTDGGYHFLSNWYWGWNENPPVIPTAYPAWEPELIIPLDGVEPYKPETVTVEPHTGDLAELLCSHILVPGMSGRDSVHVEIYRSTDGNVYAAVEGPGDVRNCFLTFPREYSENWTAEGNVESFVDLGFFGQENIGLRISYFGRLVENSYGEINDYYAFAEDGTPSLLLRALGNVTVADLDGDGTEELAADDVWNLSRLFFRRDGTLYEADLYALIHDAWPEAGYLESGFWDPDARCLSMAVEVPLERADTTALGFRTLFFDGENLRIYKDEGGYTDRIKNGIDAPADVLRQAALFVDTRLQALAAEGYGTDGSGKYDEENFGPGNVVWDDWRLTGLEGPWYETAGKLRLEIWNVSYETHTTTPDRVMLAGGSYMGEDGWCMIGYPGCDYLYFRLEENGERTFLYSTMENDCSPGTELFLSDMVNALMDQGLLRMTDLDGETLAKIMWPQSGYFLNQLAERSEGERDEILLSLAGYLSGGSEEGKSYYEGFVHELDGGGFRAEEVTPGGRAAWEKLKELTGSFTVVE